MKNQLANLNNAVTLGLVNVNDFYSITVTEHDIYLQGRFKPELVRAYGSFETDSNGFLCAMVTLCDARFKITLTD